MDNSPGWGPSSGAIAGVGLAGVLMGVACAVLAGDPPGRILTGAAALGLLIFAAGSWRARPKLELTADGLVYRGWFGSRTLRPADIDSIRISEFRRLGRKVRLLEIDARDDTLLVLSRWDLGGDPLEVLDALTDAGYTRAGPS